MTGFASNRIMQSLQQCDAVPQKNCSLCSTGWMTLLKVAVTPPSVFPVRRAPRKSCPRARRIYVTTASLLSRTSDTALTASVETNVYWAIIRAGSHPAALGWRYLNNRLLWLLRFLCLSWFPPPPLHLHHTSRTAFQLFRDNSSAFLMPAVARRVGERRGQQTISRSRRLLSLTKENRLFSLLYNKIAK